MPTITEARLAMLGAYSARWPTDETSEWKALRAVVADARRIVRETNEELEGYDKNPDISAIGKLKFRSSASLGAIKKLQELSSLRLAEREVGAAVAALDGARAEQLKPSNDPADVLREGEIRSYIRSQKDPMQVALKVATDTRVYAAIRNAPAFLSGLTPEQFNLLVAQAEGGLWPTENARKKLLQDALAEAQRAVTQAIDLIAQIGQLTRTGTGFSPRAAAA